MAGDWNFATCWEAIADGRGEAVALRHGSKTVSWAELDDRSARLASGLADLGLGAGSKVASYLYNGPAYIEGTFATWKLRAVPVNVNYRYLESELAYLLENSDAEVLLFHGVLSEAVLRVRDRAPKLKAIVQVDDDTELADGAIPYEELIATHDPAPRITRSGDDQYILYTGGTTGAPKGVMWRNDDLFQSLVPSAVSVTGEALPDDPAGFGPLTQRLGRAGRSPVHLPASPLMHGTGFFTSLQSLTLGGTIVTLTQRNFDADELWRAVQHDRVSQMAIVGDAFGRPMVAALEAAEERGEPYDLSSLVVLISSGVMWTAPVKEALMARGGFMCLDSLGSSEGVGFASQISTRGSEATTARFQIGEHTRVLTEDGRSVAPGSDEIGLLALGGPIPLGYYKDPVKTDETFRTFGGERYSVPGDWAKVASDGTIELLGRGSVSINTGGEKVFPEEVEEAMKLHPAVVDAIVVGVADDRFGEAIAAIVSVDDATTEDEIANGVRGQLAGFKRPRLVVIVDEIPRGANGKADYAWAKRIAAERARS